MIFVVVNSASIEHMSCVLVERAGGRLEIVGVCPYGTVMIALYEKFLSWKLFQQMTGIFALEECEVTVWLVL